ncbi:glycosyltransferase family 39 protein [Anaeromyxobacter oryzisoli]|uniref:glycosyltransferase family 39 protein n=1 Tax=Anaeromyxobacter oryzisoli TaxID=2925408 RepID=UPI001F55F016|nr:glycosyltransferase family 39 protein [Anaeromyxobacter sp. SG63]
MLREIATPGAGARGLVAPAVIGIVVVARLLLLPWLGLFNDEAYYWEWSRRLAPAYFDHPPLVAFALAASTRLLGDTALAVHLPAFLLSLLTSAVLFRLVLDLFPGRAELAWTSVAALNAAPLFGLGAVFTTPDAPLLSLWVATLALVWRAVHGRPRLWYLAGVAAGLGMLSKYTFALLPPAILLFLLQPRHRPWLARREPWIALAIMLALFAPVVAWNAAHGWTSFAFQSVDRFGGAFRPWRTVPRFLVAQQSVTPLLWIVCLGGLVRSARLGRAGSDAHALLAAASAVMLAFFAAASLFTYVNPNWFTPAFLTLVVAGADLLLRWRSPALRAAPLVLAAAVTLLMDVQALTPVVPIPPRTDLATDLHGWRAVGERLRALARTMPRPGRVFVYSHRLQLSALAAFHAGPGLEVTRLGGRRDDAYDDWARPRRGEDAIYFCDDQRYAPPREPFARCEPAGALPVTRGGRTVRTFHFWRCLGFEERRGAAASPRAPPPDAAATAARAGAGALSAASADGEGGGDRPPRARASATPGAAPPRSRPAPRSPPEPAARAEGASRGSPPASARRAGDPARAARWGAGRGRRAAGDPRSAAHAAGPAAPPAGAARGAAGARPTSGRAAAAPHAAEAARSAAAAPAADRGPAREAGPASGLRPSGAPGAGPTARNPE